MKIELNPIDKKHLEELARAEGKAVGALLLELVHEALSARKRIGEVPGDDANVIRRQQEALEELHEKLDALPCEGPQDGFSPQPLTLEELLRGITDENLPGEWDTGPAVGKEVW